MWLNFFKFKKGGKNPLKSQYFLFFHVVEKMSPSCAISPQQTLKFVLAFCKCTRDPNSHIMDVLWMFVTTCKQMFFNCKFMCTIANIRMKVLEIIHFVAFWYHLFFKIK
jgi:hypothetical protein